MTRHRVQGASTQSPTVQLLAERAFDFRVSGFGFRVSGFDFRVSGSGFGVLGFGFRVKEKGLGFKV